MLYRDLFSRPSWTVRTPFSGLDRVRHELDQLANYFSETPGRVLNSGVFPPVNLTQDARAVYIRAELPGINAEDLDITTTDNTITIAGERKIASEEGVKYHRREREAGNFSRAFSMPGEVDPENVSADLKNGILTIVVPKAEKEKPRQIKVK